MITTSFFQIKKEKDTELWLPCLKHAIFIKNITVVEKNKF